MIFVAGIQGAGKTTFCRALSEVLDIPNFSASELIKSWRKTYTWENEKAVHQIDENQTALICSVHELKKLKPTFIVDGHFVLLDSSLKYVNVEFSIFDKLEIRGIILIESSPDIVAMRLKSRDKTNWDVGLIQKIMMAERKRALEYSKYSGVPCVIKQNDEEIKIEGSLLYETLSWKNK